MRYNLRSHRTDSPAFDKLVADKWTVQIGRSILTNRTIPFGAVVVYAAACAWRDRGGGWGDECDGEFVRKSSATPPGGWPALAGAAPNTWRKWRDAAESAGLIEILRRDGRPHLIKPTVKIEAGEQFARVPAVVLFDPNLSRRARRAYVALALYRSADGSAVASNGQIATVARLDPRHVRRALKELKENGALRAAGNSRWGTRKYRLSVLAPPPPPACQFRPPRLSVPAPVACQFWPPSQESFQEQRIKNLLQRVRARARGRTRTRKRGHPTQNRPMVPARFYRWQRFCSGPLGRGKRRRRRRRQKVCSATSKTKAPWRPCSTRLKLPPTR